MTTTDAQQSWPGLIVLLLLSAWVGAVLVTSAVLAPAAFDVLPTRTLAGVLVGRVLTVIFLAGITLGALAAIVEFRRSMAASTLGMATALSCAIAQFVITPRIAAIRNGVQGPIDALALTDPRRMDFGRLHGLSILALGAATVGAFAIVIIISRRLTIARTG